MDEEFALTDEQWSVVDSLIFAGEPEKALWRIREWSGADPEAAETTRRQRFAKLLSERPGEFFFADYDCEDYLTSKWAVSGCWNEASQLLFVSPASDAKKHPHVPGFLVVGTAGVDGIVFGYRKGRQGVWSYSPIDEEFVLKAQTMAALVERWFAVDFEP